MNDLSHNESRNAGNHKLCFQVRFSRDQLESASTAVVRQFSPTIVQESVRFAGQTLTLQRKLLPGSLEEQRYLRGQQRRRSAQLGGGLAALDQLLSKDKELNTVEKSGLDWRRHKEEAHAGSWILGDRDVVGSSNRMPWHSEMPFDTSVF